MSGIIYCRNIPEEQAGQIGTCEGVILTSSSINAEMVEDTKFSVINHHQKYLTN
jgi:hypothetical protein